MITIKTDLVFLGFVRRLQWQDFAKTKMTQNWKLLRDMPLKTEKKAAALFATDDSKILYIVPWARPELIALPSGKYSAKNTYEKWSKRPAHEAVTVWIPSNIKKLDHVGYAEEIEYTSDKFERREDKGEYNSYMHLFDILPAVYVNCPHKPYMWGLADPDGRKIISYRGIIL